MLSAELDGVLSPGAEEVGWLAQGGRVPLGYLGDPEKTAATFPRIDGRRYAVAGDRARHGADGRIELRGRDSVCINTGGEKVFAEEVETAVKSHPAVFDAVVCGRPSPRWGEEVVAVVQLRDGATVEDHELVEVAARAPGPLQAAAGGRAAATRSCERPRARPTTAGPASRRSPTPGRHPFPRHPFPRHP